MSLVDYQKKYATVAHIYATITYFFYDLNK